MMSTQPRPRMLTRSATDRLLAGVCGGLAEHLSVPVIAVRITMAVLVLAGGAGVLLYAWLWVTVPLESTEPNVAPMRRALTRPSGTQGDRGGRARPEPTAQPAGSVPRGTPSAPYLAPPRPAGPAQAGQAQAGPQPVPPARAESAVPQPALTRQLGPAQSPPKADPAAAHTGDAPGQQGRQRPRLPVAELLFGACLLIVGILLVVQQLGVALRLSVILPGLAVLVGVGLTWWQIADRNRPDRNQVPRVLGALSLVAVGVLMFFVTAESPNIWTVMAAALAALAGVALAIAPWLLRLNRELIAERAGREREAERSEIAAHLHDSVLQTLALIQQRSAPGSEVSRIARGQERELREWLFRAADGGSAAPKETALEALRGHAAALEDAHPVRFETVGVGAEVVVPEPIVAAAREAMLNAARHAGGEVTVFAEVTAARVSIDVTDRGPGLDPAHLPEGRMGVRDSILGRMARAGGTAKIVPGPGGTGTSVRLEMPREQKPEPAGDAGAGVSP
ncbi:PspC domain-containing protein [Leucobacter komagatae]|uniref:PspC domain-containing protein n=1 Tax=Leucobacter komagatae TaxID=55969 RepID=UPI001E5B88A8|nr:PspC domain-containing protein [Leucobacter komagatae]